MKNVQKKADAVAMINPFIDSLTPVKREGGTTPKQQIAHALALRCLSTSKLHKEMVPDVKQMLAVLATRPEKLTEDDKKYMESSPYFGECRRIAATGKAVNIHLIRGLLDQKNGFKLFAAFIANGEKDENGQFVKLTTSQAATIFGRIASCPVSATLIAGFVAANKSVSFGKLTGKDWSELARCLASGEAVPAELDVKSVLPETVPAK